MFADLHLHTLFSDGTYTPEELASEGKRCGLSAMALTDHDTIEGCERMAAACASFGIEFIPATELTAEIGNHEVHILGYYLDSKSQPLREAMLKFQAIRVQRIRDMCDRLNSLGIPLSAESVFSIANCNSPGRPHIARALVKGGFCSSLDEAFDKLLRKGKPAWVPKAKLNSAEAINLIHKAGGAAALAHPVLNRSDDLIPQLARQGLDALECFHSKHSGNTPAHYMGMAKENGLAITGGSDCHGLNKGCPLIGTVKIPYAYVEELKQRAIKNTLRFGPQLATT